MMECGRRAIAARRFIASLKCLKIESERRTLTSMVNGYPTDLLPRPRL
jgi:hypothetical protein